MRETPPQIPWIESGVDMWMELGTMSFKFIESIIKFIECIIRMYLKGQKLTHIHEYLYIYITHTGKSRAWQT